MLAGGLLGSGHCLGMCGGFVVTLGATQARLPAALVRQLVYAAGRIFTYGFLGAIAGLLGARIQAWSPAFLNAQRWLSIVAGLLMIAVAFDNLGWLGWLRWRRAGHVEKGACGTFGGSLLKHFMHLPGHAASFMAGVFTGFLPCGLVYTFLLLSLRTASPVRGWLSMVVFGMGTIPALAALGCGSVFLSQVARARICRVAAVFVLVLGSMTVWRGWPQKKSCCDHAPAVPAEQSSPVAEARTGA
jgi:sulfite exporter TauE/SafE